MAPIWLGKQGGKSTAPTAIFTTKLTNTLSSELAHSLIRTFVARAIAALGALLLLVIAGCIYGPTGVGAFGLGQSLLLRAGILADYGMDSTMMRLLASAHIRRWCCAEPQEKAWLSHYSQPSYCG